jgi:SsrA-binding protein
MTDETKALATNRGARYFYEVLETFEAGIALLGHEVKSIRNGRLQIKEAYAAFSNRELWLYNCHITPWSHHTHETLTPIDPLRSRKLLMHVDELRRLKSKADEKGLTIVPLKVYFKGRKIKVEIALCKGKKLYDKRESIKKREMEREQAAEKKGFR